MVLVLSLVASTATFVLTAQVNASQRGGQLPAPPAGRPGAPIDLTGYWVSLVTDDWRWRMMTPPKGDYLYLPLNAEGRRVADSWDADKDEAAGEQCKGYGAPSVLRLPGRLHITWENDTTLKIEADAGTQTRRFLFGRSQPPAGEPTWQGHSAAQWEYDGAGRRGRMSGLGGYPEGAGPGGRGGPPRYGSLKVVTTRMRPGYFRKNGIPYSGNAVLTEYFSRISEKGAEYLVITTMLEDPQYLAAPYVRSVQFKKQADATGWNPTPCSAR